MAEPLSPDRVTEILKTATHGKAILLAGLVDAAQTSRPDHDGPVVVRGQQVMDATALKQAIDLVWVKGVRELAGEVKRLRAARDQARRGKVEQMLGRIDDWTGDLASVVAERDAARTEVERLQADLRTIRADSIAGARALAEALQRAQDAEAARNQAIEQRDAVARAAETDYERNSAALDDYQRTVAELVTERNTAREDLENFRADRERYGEWMSMRLAQADKTVRRLWKAWENARQRARTHRTERDRAQAQAKSWHDTYQDSANAVDEFLCDLLDMLPGAADEGMDAYDQIPRGIRNLKNQINAVHQLIGQEYDAAAADISAGGPRGQLDNLTVPVAALLIAVGAVEPDERDAPLRPFRRTARRQAARTWKARRRARAARAERDRYLRQRVRGRHRAPEGRRPLARLGAEHGRPRHPPGARPQRRGGGLVSRYEIVWEEPSRRAWRPDTGAPPLLRAVLPALDRRPGEWLRYQAGIPVEAAVGIQEQVLEASTPAGPRYEVAVLEVAIGRRVLAGVYIRRVPDTPENA